MRMSHTPPYHWIPVLVVALALLLALSEAHGQTPGTGASAVFEGRPAMAGAQAGQGALAGPAQGGIGVQEAVKRKPRRELAKPGTGGDIAAPKDSGLASGERSAVKKGRRGAKSALRRSRTGVGEIESRSGEGG